MEKKFIFREVDKSVVAPPPRPILDVRLDTNEDCVSLMVQREGLGVIIIQLCSNGMLHRLGSLPESLGLPLDAQGRVLLNEESAVADPSAELTLLREFVQAISIAQVRRFALSREIPYDLGQAAVTEYSQVAADVLQQIESMYKDVPA